MFRWSAAATAALLSLLIAPAAHAGGFATVGLSSTPQGVSAGTPWTVDVKVMAHGRTPIAQLEPVVRITSGSASKDFLAKPTAKTGVYRASVVFPSGGRWDYEVIDGYAGERHTFPAVQIGGAAPVAVKEAGIAPAGGDDIALGWLLAGLAAFLTAGAIFVVDRRRG